MHLRAWILCSLVWLILPATGISEEESWIEVQSPNFIVISNASQSQARRTARSFEQFRLLLQAWQPNLKVDSGAPLEIFATRDLKGLKSLLPIRQGKDAAEWSGVFLGNPERSFVAVRLDLPEERAFHVIYHEYVHKVMGLNFGKLPLWLMEGLAEFFSYAKIGEGESTLGMASPELIQTLKRLSMIPLSTLMSISSDSPHYNQQEKAQVFYAQSWALTHYLMIGDKGAHREQMASFLTLLLKGVPDEQAATQAFGDMSSLEKKLGSYINDLAFYAYQVPAKLGMREEEYGLKTLTEAESTALRGQFLVSSNRLPDAQAMLERSLQLDAQNAEANEGMGLLQLRLGSRDKARGFFLSAARQNSRSLLAQFYAAQMEFENGRNYSAAEQYLRAALALNPEFVPGINMLAQILTMQKTKLPEALALTRKASALEPAELRYRINESQVLAAMERYDEASRIAEDVLKLAKTDAEKNLAESILFGIKKHQEWVLESNRRKQSQEEEFQRREQEEYARRVAQLERQRQEEPLPPAPPKPDLSGVKKGPAAKVAGIVKSVYCDFPATMIVVLESAGKQKMLRAENYYKVQYYAVGAPGKTGFEPCEELPGSRVEIEYLTVTGQEFAGFIQSVAIAK